MIQRESYTMFFTKESDGDDFCIIDDCGRFILMNIDSFPDLLLDLVLNLHSEKHDLRSVPKFMKSDSIYFKRKILEVKKLLEETSYLVDEVLEKNNG